MNYRPSLRTIAFAAFLCACSTKIDEFPKQSAQDVKVKLAKMGFQYREGLSIVFSDPRFNKETKLFKVSPSGDIIPINFIFPSQVQSYGGTEYGSDSPLVSPNKGLVAYIRNHNLWLLNLDSMAEKQLSVMGAPRTENLNSAQILMHGWSWNSKKILISLSPGIVNEEFVGPNFKDRELNYGFYIVDIKSKDQTKIELPGSFAAWLPNDEFLLLSKSNKASDTQIIRYRLVKGAPHPIAPVKGELGQLDVSLDGEWVILNRSGAMGGKSQLLLISLKTGGIKKLSGKTAWAEDQFPRLSPLMQHFSFIKQTGPLNSFEYSLFVDNKEIYRQKEMFWPYYWVNDQLILLFNDEGSPMIVPINK